MKTKRILQIIFCAAFVLAAQWACSKEWAEDIISHSTQEQYDKAKKALGNDASETEIAEYIITHNKQ